jgi:hypothetical protein
LLSKIVTEILILAPGHVGGVEPAPPVVEKLGFSGWRPGFTPVAFFSGLPSDGSFRLKAELRTFGIAL